MDEIFDNSTNFSIYSKTNKKKQKAREKHSERQRERAKKKPTFHFKKSIVSRLNICHHLPRSPDQIPKSPNTTHQIYVDHPHQQNHKNRTTGPLQTVHDPMYLVVIKS